MASVAETEKRNRYWFENWQDFTCQVVVSTPAQRSLHVGAIVSGLFASIPIPYQSRDTDSGTFVIRDGCFWVYSPRETYCWPLSEAQVAPCRDGVEVRCPNHPVVTLRGPVAAPLAGAYASMGRLEV
jgi:hypothetical protein